MRARCKLRFCKGEAQRNFAKTHSPISHLEKVIFYTFKLCLGHNFDVLRIPRILLHVAKEIYKSGDVLNLIKFVFNFYWFLFSFRLVLY